MRSIYSEFLIFKLFTMMHPLGVFSAGIRKLQGQFPVMISVNTTIDVASQYSNTWDIQKKGSKRLTDGTVHLRIVANDEEELAQFDELVMSGHLIYEALPMQNVRNLGGINVVLSCYRTVAETFASMDDLVTQYPGFVTVTSIGSSWLKQQGQGGHDIKVMVLSAPSGLTKKHNMMVVGGHHSRELPPPETIMRWAEHLLSNYNKDADITWVLDRTNIHLLPVANPDGRQIVQNNLDWLYRKNAHSYGCGSVKDEGVDLNRNYPMWWGLDSGSSNSPCAASFRGGSELSEPESTAIYRYASGLFSANIKKGTSAQAEARASEACPVDATGIFIDVHSYGDFVYFPWGYEDSHSPNHQSLLTMAAKLAKRGDYALWGPGQDGFLYFVSGDVTDSTYGIDCVASFGYELGSAWYASCTELGSTIVPIMTSSLLYAAKSVSAPYKIPLGPDIMSIRLDYSDPTSTILTVLASDEALIASHAKFDNAKSHPIASVQVFVDVHPYDSSNNGITMSPQDGAFDSVDEVAIYSLDTTGSKVLYFQATDQQGYTGPVSAVYVGSSGSNNGNGQDNPVGSCSFLEKFRSWWGF